MPVDWDAVFKEMEEQEPISTVPMRPPQNRGPPLDWDILVAKREKLASVDADTESEARPATGHSDSLALARTRSAEERGTTRAAMARQEVSQAKAEHRVLLSSELSLERQQLAALSPIGSSERSDPQESSCSDTSSSSSPTSENELDGKAFVLRRARVIPQPAEGSCLFHCMAYTLDGTSAASLRREIADWIGANPTVKIADTIVSDWVQWESGSSVSTYARRMRVRGWGGGIEMAACSVLKGVNIHGARIISFINIRFYEQHNGKQNDWSCAG